MRLKKRFLTCLVLIYSFSVPITFGNGLTAHAQTEYLRITEYDTPFYADSNLTEFLFFLPYSYYLKLLSVDEQAVKVEISGEIPAIDGYVKKNLLSSDGQNVDNPYPALKITTCRQTALYSDYELKNESRYIFAERELNYYGYVKTQTGYAYFVSYGDSVGYVKEDSLYPFTVPLHKNPFLGHTEEVKPAVKPAENGVSLTVRIIIIGCLVAAGLIAAIIFRKPKEQDGAYYDENDYG